MIHEMIAERAVFTPQNGEKFDLVIIGAGPAGMSAALCAGRAHLKTLILEKALPGGQIGTAYTIKNYLGFSKDILGEQLALKMEAQLDKYDLYYSRETVLDIEACPNELKVVQTDANHFYLTKTVIIATGLEPKKLETDFEKAFLGRGLSYYAQSDWKSYRNKNVAVIGGGNCACYAADFLAEYANHVYVIHRFDTLKAVKSLKEKILNNPKITVLWQSEVVEAFGLKKLEKIRCTNAVTQNATWIEVQGMFVYIGRIPPKEILHMGMALDEEGYVVTDETMRTSLKGIYAAGDIRSKQIRQIATAVADGMIAAINAEREVSRL